jgi:hypothetical protein
LTIRAGSTKLNMTVFSEGARLIVMVPEGLH